MTVTENRRDYLESLYQDMPIKELRTLAAERTPEVKSRSKQAYAEALLAWHIAVEEATQTQENTTPEQYDNDAWFAEKVQRDMKEMQASRVAHAQACGFVPQEGDICVNAPYAKHENYQEFSLFRYESGLWVYHTSMQVGIDRYLSSQGYKLIVKFGKYAEGYYSQHEPVEDDEELTTEDIVAIEEALAQPSMGPYTFDELCQVLTQEHSVNDAVTVELYGKVIPGKITEVFEDGWGDVRIAVELSETWRGCKNLWFPAKDVKPDTARRQVQTNLIKFFEAAYDYCHTIVPDYLPQPHEWIYGSLYRPISPSWARIPNAHYVQVDWKTEYMYTWVVTPQPLDEKTIADYELKLVRLPEITYTGRFQGYHSGLSAFAQGVAIAAYMQTDAFELHGPLEVMEWEEAGKRLEAWMETQPREVVA